MAAEEAFTGKEFSPERCPSESMGMEVVTSEEDRSLRLCPAKRKASAAGHLLEEGAIENKEEDEGKVISEYQEDGSDDDDDDKSITESEFDAFVEEEMTDYRRFWQKEVFPRNPDWNFKDYSLVTKEGDICDGNAKGEAAPESNR